MDKIKIGIIGVGNISKSHIDGYKKDPRAELYAFCDIDPKRLAMMGKEYEVEKLYTDIDEMLALPELEAVSVCTWNNAHAECAIKAMKAGKHVLCEKPMALNTALAEEMKRVSEETGKLLMIGFVRRFGDDCTLLKEYNDTGFFGDLYYIKVRNLRRNGNPGGWFGKKELSGGGPLIDLGVHVIDLMCYVMGDDVKPVSVFGATFNKLSNRPDVLDRPPYVSHSSRPGEICNVEDLATAMVRFNNGAVMSIEVAFCLNLPHDESDIAMYGSKAGATFKPGLVLSTNTGNRMSNIELCSKSEFDFRKSFRAEISHFLDCIIDGKECRTPAKDGVKLMKILDAIYKSAETGHEVAINL